MYKLPHSRPADRIAAAGAYAVVIVAGLVCLVLAGVEAGPNAPVLITQTALMVGAGLAALASLFRTLDGNAVLGQVHDDTNGRSMARDVELGYLRDLNTLYKVALREHGIALPAPVPPPVVPPPMPREEPRA